MPLQPKVGDIVHVRVRVTSADEFGSMSGKLIGSTCSIPEGQIRCYDRCDIAHIEPRPIQVGDKVTLKGGSMPYEVKAIVGTKAWATGVTFGTETIKELSELVRID